MQHVDVASCWHAAVVFVHVSQRTQVDTIKCEPTSTLAFLYHQCCHQKPFQHTYTWSRRSCEHQFVHLKPRPCHRLPHLTFPRPARRGFGANLVRRVKRAGTDLISRVPRTARSRSRSRLDDVTDSPDSASLGSGSGGNESVDSGPDSLRKSPQQGACGAGQGRNGLRWGEGTPMG